MGKKSKRSRKSGDGGGGSVVSDDGASPAAQDAPTEEPRPAPALRPIAEQTEETMDNLRCEDPYEDVYDDEDDDEEYEDVYESSGDEDDEYMEHMADGDDAKMAGAAKKKGEEASTNIPTISMKDGANPPAQVKSWNPFSGNQTGETLEMDESAYKMHHALTPEWPSLTLDIIPDRHLGEHRTRFPHTVTMVVGSQADVQSKNKLNVLRMSDLCRIPGSRKERTEKDLDDEMLGEEWKDDDGESDAEGSESDDDDEEEEELDPALEHYSFPHACGGINRVRVCPHNSDIVGVWSDSGVVSLYDVGGALDVLDRSALGSKNGDVKPQPVRKMRKDPFFVYAGHSTEGYALDWSRVAPGRLATADCDGNIHVWNATHPVRPNDIVAQYKKASPWGNS